jgi:hypothetical protein
MHIKKDVKGSLSVLQLWIRILIRSGFNRGSLHWDPDPGSKTGPHKTVKNVMFDADAFFGGLEAESIE